MSDPTRSPTVLIQALRAGELIPTDALVGADLRNADLSGLRLAHLDARGAQFEGANMSRTVWADCRLDEARLDGAALEGASFTACRGQAVSWRESQVVKVWMKDCVWQDSDFHLAALTRLAAQSTAFPGSRMKTAKLDKAWLSHCDLSGLDLAGAAWRQTHLPDSKLAGTTLAGAVLAQCSFNRAQAPGADFNGITAPAVSFYAAQLENARFDGAVLDGAIFDQARLDRASFARASLQGARFYAASSTGISFGASKLVDADLSHLRSAHTNFDEADLSGARIHAAELPDASWREAVLENLRRDDPELRTAELWRPPV